MKSLDELNQLLGYLNLFYTEDLISLAEFNVIKNKIVDRMIKALEQEKESLENS